MEQQNGRFDFLTPHWLERAHVYHGSEGALRYRFVMKDEKNKETGVRSRTVDASTYTTWCFEKAEDVESRSFSWDEEGVAALRRWLEAEYDRRCAAGG